MAKGVFVHRTDSIYEDEPEIQYQFPRQYLSRVQQVEHDWIVYYEPRGGGGRLGYNAIARVSRIIEDPKAENMYLALIEPGSYISFGRFIPYKNGPTYYESMLARPDGSLMQGRMQSAVRPLSDHDFATIVELGLSTDSPLPDRTDAPETDMPVPGVHDQMQPFEPEFDRKRIDLLLSRPVRDRSFRKTVLDAYDSRCALTGLKLINGGGRAEVEAAHIRPVADKGSDSVRNGLALSGTVHWMFDRGLITLSEDYTIQVSRHVNDPDRIWGLMTPDRRAILPRNAMLRPHPRYLEWHRQNCYKY